MRPEELTPYEMGFIDRLLPVDRDSELTPAQIEARRLIDHMGKGALAYFPVKSLSDVSSLPLAAYNRFGTQMGEDEVIKMLKRVAAEQKPTPKTRLSLDLGPGVGDLYDPIENAVQLNKDNLRRGVVAHEFGHAMRPGMKNLYHYGGKLGNLMMYPSAFLGDEDMREMAGIVGSGAMLPRVYEEIMASRAGSKLLKDQGVKGMRRLSPFVGVPTYAAAATLPYLMAKTRGWLDKFMDADASRK